MAHRVYDNFILENKIEDLLTTAVDLNTYMTIDTSLTEEPGMVKKINTYTSTGNVQDLEMGIGNTDEINVDFATSEYRVGVTQGRFNYFDEQEMTDPTVIDAGLQGLSQKMVNDLTAKAIAEFEKATLVKHSYAHTFDDVVDAIALMNIEAEEGLFLLISPADKAEFRKNLKDDLKYVEGFVRTGYIGSVAGVPVIVSKAVPADEAFLATSKAVSCFVKKGAEIEQEREANIRKNSVFARKVMVVALTDATQVVKLTVEAA